MFLLTINMTGGIIPIGVKIFAHLIEAMRMLEICLDFIWAPPYGFTRDLENSLSILMWIVGWLIILWVQCFMNFLVGALFHPNCSKSTADWLVKLSQISLKSYVHRLLLILMTCIKHVIWVLLLSCSLFVLGLIILTLGVTLIRLNLSMVIEQCEMMLLGCLDSDGGPHRLIFCVGISEFLESLGSRLPWRMQLNLHS